MWFRLKADYIIQKDEIHYHTWGIKKIKAGAPITVGFLIDNEGEVTPDILFEAGELRHFTLDMLAIPPDCTKDPVWGNIFCAINQKLFYSGSEGRWLVKKMNYCPLCGGKLVDQDLFPGREHEWEEK
jgi:hypothetical protein